MVSPELDGATASTGFCVIRANRAVLEPSYVFHWVKSTTFVSRMVAQATGASYPAVSDRIVLDAEIPLPPLPEQRRIAAILDKADALRTQRREALAHLDRLAQAIFVEMFGDPVTNPKGWPVVDVGSISDVQGGLQVTTARKNLPVEVPYLRVANVHRGRLELGEVKTIRATENEVARTKLNPQDVLVVEGHGNPEEVGRAAIWNGEVAGCVHQNHLIRVRFIAERVLPTYACAYLNSSGGRQHLLRAGKTTSGLNTISVSNVRAVPVALPTLVAQKTYEAQVAEVDGLKATHRQSELEGERFFAALQHRAFRGEL